MKEDVEIKLISFGSEFLQVIQKNPESECITPLKPQSLTHGYGIQLEECLTMKYVIEESGGTLEKKLFYSSWKCYHNRRDGVAV